MNGIKPWAYRPQEYDDWGVIRDADGDLTARAVGGEFYRADAHREAGTNPVGDRAKEIVRAVNCHDDLVAALTELLETCAGVSSYDVPYHVREQARAALANVEKST